MTEETEAVEIIIITEVVAIMTEIVIVEPDITVRNQK